jgi:hypothetical protein
MLPGVVCMQVVLLLDALDEADPVSEQLAASAAAARAALAAEGQADAVRAIDGGAAPTSIVPAGNRAFQLLKDQLLPRLPQNVRLLITTRPDAIGGRVLPALHALSSGSCTELGPQELRLGSGGGGGAAADARSGQRVMLVQTVRREVLLLDPAEGGPGSSSSVGPGAETLGALYEAYGTCFERRWKELGAQAWPQVKYPCSWQDSMPIISISSRKTCVATSQAQVDTHRFKLDQHHQVAQTFYQDSVISAPKKTLNLLAITANTNCMTSTTKDIQNAIAVLWLKMSRLFVRQQCQSVQMAT